MDALCYALASASAAAPAYPAKIIRLIASHLQPANSQPITAIGDSCPALITRRTDLEVFQKCRMFRNHFVESWKFSAAGRRVFTLFSYLLLPFGLSQRTLPRRRQTQIQKPLNIFFPPLEPRENLC